MISLTKEDRKELGSKIMDLGNLTFAAVTLGQAFREKSFNVFIAFLGIFVWMSILGIALFVKKGGKLWKTN